MRKLQIHKELFSPRGVLTRILPLLLAISVLGSFQSAFASNQELSPTRTMPLVSSHKNVLVLFSYHRAEWSDNVQKGIESVFYPYQNVNLFYEYMDTKRLKTNKYLETLRNIYTEKYSETHIELILCVDNNALDLVVKNAQILFTNTPVVFCGINNYDSTLHAARPNVTGVVEYGDFADTLKIAFKARPKATKLYIICDHTETGEINTQDLVAVLSSVAPHVQAVLTDRMSYEELSTTLKNADPKQLAFFVSFWKDGKGGNIEQWRLDDVFRRSAVPVFGRSEWMINHGMVGGKCVTGFAQGEAAAKIALEILGGTPASALPVDTKSPNQYLFDQRMLEHHLINEDVFPDESIGFNRPEPFYRVSKTIGLTVAVFSTLLLAALVFLIVSIRQRRQAEKEMRESKDLLESVIENIPLMIFLKEPSDLRFVLFNLAGEELLGYERNTLIGKNNLDLFPHEQAAHFMAKDREVLDGETGILDIPEEAILTVKKGTRLLHTRKVCIKSPDGTAKYLLGISEDITEQKRSEVVLRESERKWRAIFDGAPVGIVLMNHETEVLECNQHIADIFGVEREKYIGLNIMETLPDGILRKSLIEAQNDGKIHHYEGPYASVLSGKQLYIDITVEMIAPDIIIVIMVDITDQRKTELAQEKLQEQLHQAQKMESVALLAGGVAHDFNNMLSVILGHAELAMNRLDPTLPAFTDLKKIHNAAERSANLTRQLLAFARKQNVAPKVLDLNETVEGMLTMLRRLIGENITLLWMPGSGLWPVKVDPTQIDQILANLSVNARDAIGDVGRIIVETANSTFDENYCALHLGFLSGDYVRISLTDNGCGMDQETQARIFEPFFTTKGIGAGTGLGLASVYGAVKQNMGFINVESEQGQGTTFSVYLPRYVGDLNRPLTIIEAEPALRGNETILLVEDELTLLDMISTMLQELGYTILAAGTPSEAHNLIENNGGKIDMLLTDVIMPEMNGRELAERLLLKFPGMRCLFMSGYTADIIANHGVINNGLNFIQKPFLQRELATIVRKAMDRGKTV